MHLFGMGALAWRLFDFTLLGIATAAFFLLTANLGGPPFPASSERVGSLAALFASSLFILIHGRDGLSEGGQRDLTMAVCLLAATAFLFLAVRKRKLWPAAAFGLLSGIASTIKPTTLPLTLAQLALALYALNKIQGESVVPETVIPSGARSAKCGVPGELARWGGKSRDPRIFLLVISAALAYLAAPILALIFLVRERALAAFLAGFYGITPVVASLGHPPLTFVLLHSISPLLPLVLLWLGILVLLRSQLHWERAALLAGVVFGLLNCVVQQRALPYYRYPLLVFLLPLMAIDFTRALRPGPNPSAGAPFVTALSSPVGSDRAAKYLAALALAFAAFFLAPQSAVLIHRYRWRETDFISSLQQNLNALGGSSLSGHIQCIDSISGCGNVLYRMRLSPSTGVLSDFLLFGAASDRQPPESIPIQIGRAH